MIAKCKLNNNVIDNKTFDNLSLNDVFVYGKSNENDLNMLMYYQDAVYNELENLTQIPDLLIE